MQQPLDYQSPQTKPRWGWKSVVSTVIFSLMCLSGACVFYAVLTRPEGSGSRESAQRVKCMINLGAIGKALMQYAAANEGWLPDDLHHGDLHLAGTTTLRCPNDSKAESYLYAGAGLNVKDLPSDVVLVYQPMALHLDDGMIVLFADGATDFIGRKAALDLLAAENAGRRPLVLGEAPSSAPAGP